MDQSRRFYGVPARMAPIAEDIIVDTVLQMVPQAYRATLGKENY